MTSTNPHQTLTMKSRLRERAAPQRGENKRTRERASDETHLRVAEKARDTQDH
jgi:hypothetical protein